MATSSEVQVDQELDSLLHDHWGITRGEFIAALKTLPALPPGAATLTEAEARLLDDAGFIDEPADFAAVGTQTAGHLAQLTTTAFTAEEVADGLRISASRVRQKRIAGALWAIDDGRSWLFPVPQFETDERGAPVRVIRGFDQVFTALPSDLHPLAVEQFLRTPQPDLYLDRPLTPLEWLRGGGDIDQAVHVATLVDWYAR